LQIHEVVIFNMIASLFLILISILLILIAIAFITLLERKILALTQLRVGPNKVVLKGLVQPLIDGIKLLQKHLILPYRSYLEIFVFIPFLLIRVIILTWRCIWRFPYHSIYWISVLLLIVLFSVRVYGIFLIGWRGASKYAFIGGIRACAQRLSYEVRLALVLLATIFLSNHRHVGTLRRILLIGRFILWITSILAETNRAPLDLAEGERELIRGLNIEHGSFILAYILVGEYGMVLSLSWITSLIFLNSNFLIVLFIISIMLLLRSTLPRLRYDKLIRLCWTFLLPIALLWSIICYFI